MANREREVMSPDSSEPGVVIRGLRHRFARGDDSRPVLDDINLDLNPGEIVIMTGPSGSGKTTLLTLIGALRSIQEGSLRIMGQELMGLEADELVNIRRDIGFIFQAHNLLDALSARQNVRLALEIAGKDISNADALADEMLTRLGLGHRIEYKPDGLSGGQRQRVAVARALVTRPRLVLADEPTAALDEESGQIVVELLRERADQDGVTVLIVTHDNRILNSADRIVGMMDGKIASNIVVEETLEICQFLQKCDVFQKMTPDELTEVSQKMLVESYEPDAEIIRFGDEGDRFYVVRDGVLDVLVPEGDRMKTVTQLGKGDFFGEAALITGEPRNATVVARSPVDVYSLGKESFQEALAASKSFSEQLRARFFQRV